MANSKYKGNTGVIKPMTDKHRDVIDVYFNNGYNGVKAVLEILPTLTYQGASSLFKTLMKTESNKAYIEAKRNRLKAKADISTEQVLRELIQWAYSDATEYIGLNPTQLKELPPDVRRCIQSVKHSKKTYETRNGDTVTEEYTEVKLIDKTKAIEAISKAIGLYEIDNKQKQTQINLNQLNVNTLNNLVQAMNSKDRGQSDDIKRLM